MNQNDLNSILESLKKMENISQKIISYFEMFQKKTENIYKQFKVKQLSTSDESYRIFIDGLDNKIDTLKQMYIELVEITDQFSRIEIKEVSLQYRNFLINELVNLNWNNFSYTDEPSSNYINHYFEKIDESAITYSNEDEHAIQGLNWIMQNYNQILSPIQNKIAAIKVFDKVKDIDCNIVLIGANGSGKSTFARNLRGKLSDNVTILSAQHLLIYTKPETISINNMEIELVYNFQSRDKLGSDADLVHLFSNDLNNLISALFSENRDREHNYYVGTEQKKDSVLLRVIKIWDEIIVHRRLKYLNNSLTANTLEGNTYDFNHLSDGEKAVFYYIAHVLLAKKESYIIIDEPESHLHLAICNKLWDVLEQERKDCKFIYITHNLDFATSRNNKVILWNKKFNVPSEWDVVRLETVDSIPERLLMEIIGSKKNILFCEGDDQTSYDYKLYSILFPKYTIIPVGGHLNVINYCMAYNKNKTLYGQEAIGIIDGDCHFPQQIEKWKENNIFTLQVNEIENILCDECILESAAISFCSKENAIESFKNKFFSELEKDKERQAVWYASNAVNNYFKVNMLKEKKELNSLKTELENILTEDVIQKNYDLRLNAIEKFIENKDYENALRVSDFKGKLIGYIAAEIINDYKERIFTHISRNEELQDKIKKKYFAFLC